MQKRGTQLYRDIFKILWSIRAEIVTFCSKICFPESHIPYFTDFGMQGHGSWESDWELEYLESNCSGNVEFGFPEGGDLGFGIGLD